ncbi:NIPSNAP family protein [Sphingomonas sp. NPDC079357]|uniref:NIPSNAP family protein n=1 Tax=Sphingomonas sp. NPDC079357 TaxID=3364518 RepID=UPI00384FC340
MPYPIDRRAVLAGAILGGMTLATADAAGQARGSTSTPEFYELRTYHLVNGPMRARLDTYLRDAFIPAARRAGCGPVGVFTISIGPASPSVLVLIPHSTLADFAALPGRLAADSRHTQAGAAFLDAPPTDPGFTSMDVKLMRAFPHFPRVEAPAGGTARIFELRTYFSPSGKTGATKIGMFDTGGEIEIFRRTGLTPVFFAQDLTGERLPSLTYMLTFPDLATREQNWRTFVADPAWKRLIATPGLTDPEITTGIDNRILGPTPYSQI